MYLKIPIVLVFLLVLQPFGMGARAQTEVPKGCTLTADGKVDCSAMAKDETESAGAVASEAVKTRSILGPAVATRIFSHPKQYPPHEFGAYAIVAFKSVADSSDLERHLMICEAYMSAIPDSSLSDLPKENQLATVWPLDKEESYGLLTTKMANTEVCKIAVENYGHTSSLKAIRDAKAVSPEMHEHVVRNRGPFLFAWNPGGTKGKPDALILRMDLSNVMFPTQAKRRFEFWVQEIEENPQVWQDGWQKLPIRNRIAETADRYGQVILDFVGG